MYNFDQPSIDIYKFYLNDLNSYELRDLFIDHGDQIMNWENDKTSVMYLNKNKTQDKMLSMMK